MWEQEKGGVYTCRVVGRGRRRRRDSYAFGSGEDRKYGSGNSLFYS